MSVSIAKKQRLFQILKPDIIYKGNTIESVTANYGTSGWYNRFYLNSNTSYGDIDAVHEDNFGQIDVLGGIITPYDFISARSSYDLIDDNIKLWEYTLAYSSGSNRINILITISRDWKLVYYVDRYDSDNTLISSDTVTENITSENLANREKAALSGDPIYLYSVIALSEDDENYNYYFTSAFIGITPSSNGSIYAHTFYNMNGTSFSQLQFAKSDLEIDHSSKVLGLTLYKYYYFQNKHFYRFFTENSEEPTSAFTVDDLLTLLKEAIKDIMVLEFDSTVLSGSTWTVHSNETEGLKDFDLEPFARRLYAHPLQSKPSTMLNYIGPSDTWFTNIEDGNLVTVIGTSKTEYSQDGLYGYKKNEELTRLNDNVIGKSLSTGYEVKKDKTLFTDHNGVEISETYSTGDNSIYIVEGNIIRVGDDDTLYLQHTKEDYSGVDLLEYSQKGIYKFLGASAELLENKVISVGSNDNYVISDEIGLFRASHNPVLERYQDRSVVLAYDYPLLLSSRVIQTDDNGLIQKSLTHAQDENLLITKQSNSTIENASTNEAYLLKDDNTLLHRSENGVYILNTNIGSLYRQVNKLIAVGPDTYKFAINGEGLYYWGKNNILEYVEKRDIATPLEALTITFKDTDIFKYLTKVGRLKYKLSDKLVKVLEDEISNIGSYKLNFKVSYIPSLDVINIVNQRVINKILKAFSAGCKYYATLSNVSMPQNIQGYTSAQREYEYELNKLLNDEVDLSENIDIKDDLFSRL